VYITYLIYASKCTGRLAGGVEWMQLAEDMDRWQVLVNTVKNFQVLAPWG
jgi:hypothetical protein